MLSTMVTATSVRTRVFERVQRHRIESLPCIPGRPAKYGKPDWVRIRNKYFACSQKIGSGARFRVEME